MGLVWVEAVLAEEEKWRESRAARLRGVEGGGQWRGEDERVEVEEEERSREGTEGEGGKAGVIVGGASLVVGLTRDWERRVTTREARQQR